MSAPSEAQLVPHYLATHNPSTRASMRPTGSTMCFYSTLFFEPYRANPRFQALLQKMNLA